MAEEKAETLQLELEVCKERLEEVTLDMEILKTEMQQRGNENVLVYGVKLMLLHVLKD